MICVINFVSEINHGSNPIGKGAWFWDGSDKIRILKMTMGVDKAGHEDDFAQVLRAMPVDQTRPFTDLCNASVPDAHKTISNGRV
jgi:hypothetical protein